mmetsp:Transcript_15574/g.28967  ORF Transcript_15574/g.28967 Transcript_15574/m.28967 type:complete len:763 (-) Transcript_15574:98-2386(-)
MAEDSRTARYLAEFLGTLLLTFSVGCNTLSDKYIWGSTSNAATLMVLIYAFGDVSGAHFNPAVTIAAFISNRHRDILDTVFYIIVQVIGAIFGALLYALMFWQTFNLAPKPGFSWFQAGVCELLYTGMLCFVVLNCGIAARRGGSQFGGLAIGFVLIAAGNSYGAGAVSGAVLNPAIAFAIDLSSAGLGFGWSMAYIGWQLMGAAMAAVFFRLCRPIEFNMLDMVIFAEKKIGQETRLSMLLAEFLGTFYLTLTVGLNVLCLSRVGAWSIACALMCMIYSLADVSGAQFNPAVTLAVVASGRQDYGVTSQKKGAMFIAVQFLAGIMGAWTFVMIYSGHTFSLGPVDSYTWGSRVPIEIFFTFVLCFTVLCVATARGTPKDDILGFAVGMCIVVGGYVVSMVSGGTMNPAVTFGVASTGVVCTNCTSFWWSLMYILLEIAGALLATAVFFITRPGEFHMKLKPNLLPEHVTREFQARVEKPVHLDATSPTSKMPPPPQRPPTGASLASYAAANTGPSAYPAMAGPYSVTGLQPAPPRVATQQTTGSGGVDSVMESARTIFRTLDRDRNNTVSKIEMIVGLKNSKAVQDFFGLPAQMRQEDADVRRRFEEIFQGIDRDNNKVLSWEELEFWVRNHPERFKPARNSTDAQQPVVSPFAIPTGSMGPQMPGLTMGESSPMEFRPPPVYSVIQADEYANLSGTQVPIFKEYQMSAMHASQLREYAYLLSRLIGPGHSPLPESDAALMPWILAMQRNYLYPLQERAVR